MSFPELLSIKSAAEGGYSTVNLPAPLRSTPSGAWELKPSENEEGVMFATRGDVVIPYKEFALGFAYQPSNYGPGLDFGPFANGWLRFSVDDIEVNYGPITVQLSLAQEESAAPVFGPQSPAITGEITIEFWIRFPSGIPHNQTLRSYIEVVDWPAGSGFDGYNGKPVEVRIDAQHNYRTDIVDDKQIVTEDVRVVRFILYVGGGSFQWAMYWDEFGTGDHHIRLVGTTTNNLLDCQCAIDGVYKPHAYTDLELQGSGYVNTVIKPGKSPYQPEFKEPFKSDDNFSRVSIIAYKDFYNANPASGVSGAMIEMRDLRFYPVALQDGGFIPPSYL
jgi:hypothetical protein